MTGHNLLPTQHEREQVNQQRKRVAANFKLRGQPGVLLLGVPGPCSADNSRMPDDTLAHVHHGQRMAAVAARAGNTLLVLRDDGEKPRTSKGMTGLIHQPGGARTYVEGARLLHAAGVPLAAEIVSATGAAVMLPHLTIARIGAREVSATGPRYDVRPTEQDIDNGIHPVPVLVKTGQNGSLTHTLNALHTIMSEKRESRLHLGLLGMEEVVTLGNPYVGVTLRGNDVRPTGNLIDVVGAEIYEARDALDREFGKGAVALTADCSHAYAKYGHEDGGEVGQLAMAATYQELIKRGAPLDGWTAETYVLPGKQAQDGNTPGLSFTDACVRQELAEGLVVDFDKAWPAYALEDEFITV